MVIALSLATAAPTSGSASRSIASPPRTVHLHPKPNQGDVIRVGLNRPRMRRVGSWPMPAPLHSVPIGACAITAAKSVSPPGEKPLKKPVYSVPVWSMYCNCRKIGFPSLGKASEETRLMLKKMQSDFGLQLNF